MYVDLMGFVTVYVCSNIRQISSKSHYKLEIAHPSRVSEHTSSRAFWTRLLNIQTRNSSTSEAYFYTIKHRVLNTSVNVKPRLVKIEPNEISMENVEVSFSSIHSSFWALPPSYKIGTRGCMLRTGSLTRILANPIGS